MTELTNLERIVGRIDWKDRIAADAATRTELRRLADTLEQAAIECGQTRGKNFKEWNAAHLARWRARCKLESALDAICARLP